MREQCIVFACSCIFRNTFFFKFQVTIFLCKILFFSLLWFLECFTTKIRAAHHSVVVGKMWRGDAEIGAKIFSIVPAMDDWLMIRVYDRHNRRSALRLLWYFLWRWEPNAVDSCTWQFLWRDYRYANGWPNVPICPIRLLHRCWKWNLFIFSIIIYLILNWDWCGWWPWHLPPLLFLVLKVVHVASDGCILGIDFFTSIGLILLNQIANVFDNEFTPGKWSSGADTATLVLEHLHNETFFWLLFDGNFNMAQIFLFDGFFRFANTSSYREIVGQSFWFWCWRWWSCCWHCGRHHRCWFHFNRFHIRFTFAGALCFNRCFGCTLVAIIVNDDYGWRWCLSFTCFDDSVFEKIFRFVRT